jgi:6-phospho-3-hexuloisomerase
MALSGFTGCRRLALEELHAALGAVDDSQAAAAAEALGSARRVFVIGVGRVFLSLQAFAKRLNHLRIPAYPVGAIDEPPAGEGDLLVVGSGSGESIVPVVIARKAKSLGARILYIGSSTGSTAAGLANLVLRIPCRTKLGLAGEIPSRQLMSSLFEQAVLLACDCLCLMIAEGRGMDPEAIARGHANLE